MSVSMHTRKQKDLNEAPSVDFDLVTPAPGGSLAVRPRRQWYAARPEDLAPLSPEYMKILTALNTFGLAGASTAQVAKIADADSTATQQALGQMIQKGVVKKKGQAWFVDRVGRVHLSGTLDSVTHGDM